MSEKIMIEDYETMIEKERDIYLRALRTIAHWCFVAEGYAAEMQTEAKRAIHEGQKIRTTG